MNTNWYIFNCVNKLNVYGPHFMVKIYWTASQNVILYKLFCDRVVINWVFHRDWKIKASCLHHQRDDWKVWVNMAVHKNCSALRIMCTSGLHQSNVTRCKNGRLQHKNKAKWNRFKYLIAHNLPRLFVAGAGFTRRRTLTWRRRNVET